MTPKIPESILRTAARIMAEHAQTHEMGANGGSTPSDDDQLAARVKALLSGIESNELPIRNRPAPLRRNRPDLFSRPPPHLSGAPPA